MKIFQQEVEENYSRFAVSLRDSAQQTAKDLESNRDKYLESYRRLTSLQAWRSELLETTMSPGGLGFFLEAQNDALTSHALATFGAWRSALKSLRSCIENTLLCLYYMDHPVELRLWENGQHKPGFTAMDAYFVAHPALSGIPVAITGLEVLREEYATLSRAVHATGKTFRMSIDGVGPQLWSSEVSRLGAWSTREKATVSGLNCLLMCLFREHLEGSRVPNLRKAISLSIQSRKLAEIKRVLGITLFSV
jgi:hypothetical protein